jgi:phage tail tape-measure protein
MGDKIVVRDGDGASDATVSQTTTHVGQGHGAPVAGAVGGAVTGAVVGSVVPGIGTAVGAVVGGAVGALAGKVEEDDKGTITSTTTKAG